MTDTIQIVRGGFARERTYDATVVVVGGVTARRYTDSWTRASFTNGDEFEGYESGWELVDTFDGLDDTGEDSVVQVGDTVVMDIPQDLIDAIMALEKGHW